MAFCGWQVTREYYINDAGAQVDILARSAYLRYCQARGRDIGEIPAGLYPGLYLTDVGAMLAAKYGDNFLDKPEDDWLSTIRSEAIAAIMGGIEEDLANLGISMDRFSSEQALVDSGAVQIAIERLQATGHLYHGMLQPPKGKEPEDWEPREYYCSKPRLLVMIPTGRCRNPMAVGRILQRMLPIIWKSWNAPKAS